MPGATLHKQDTGSVLFTFFFFFWVVSCVSKYHAHGKAAVRSGCRTSESWGPEATLRQRSGGKALLKSEEFTCVTHYGAFSTDTVDTFYNFVFWKPSPLLRKPPVPAAPQWQTHPPRSGVRCTRRASRAAAAFWGHLLGPPFGALSLTAGLPSAHPLRVSPPGATSRPQSGARLPAGIRRAPRLPPGPARPAHLAHQPLPVALAALGAHGSGRRLLPARPAAEQPAGRGGAWRRPARAWPRPPGLSGAPGPPPRGCGAPAGHCGPARVVPQPAGGTPEVFLASLHPPPSNILRLKHSFLINNAAPGSRGCPHSTVNKGMGIRVCRDFNVTCVQTAPREWSTRSLYA